MDTLQVMPDNILRTQVCQECFQYLSVGPVTVNSQGEKICGRCNLGTGTKSLFNMVTDSFLFKCTNHLNGCSEVLPGRKIKKHELTCFYERQDCFFCSFCGNLLQILNHSLKVHLENVTFDGVISFSLFEESFKKILMFLIENDIFLITVEITDEIFTISIQCVTKNLTSKINHYGVKFFKPEEPSDSDLIITDFSMFHDEILNYFKKPKDQLATFFGPGTNLCCQMVVEQLSLETKELEFQRRYSKLRRDEEQVNTLNRKLESERRDLDKKSESHDVATEVIKVLSHNLLKCISCLKTCPTEMYFCSKIHCVCKHCLTSICIKCKTTREFKKLSYIESFEVPCDFLGCNKKLTIKEYLEHQSACLKRPYKCPLQDCNQTILSANELIEHWHSEMPVLYLGDTRHYDGYKCEEFYWMLKNNLYRVLINFDKDSLHVLIDEINVLPNDTLFKCQAYCAETDRSGVQWYEIKSSEFCGKFFIHSQNSINIMSSGRGIKSTMTVKFTKLRICV